MILCRLFWHRWTRWRIHRTIVSLDSETIYVQRRMCLRCGLIQEQPTNTEKQST